MQFLNPMMLGMAAGSMIGHLATRSFGQYDLPIPRPPSDALAVVAPTIAAFGDEWSIDGDDLRLWVCLQEVAHHAVMGVPHVRARLESLIQEYVAGFRSDPHALEERMENLDVNPGNMSDMAGIQQLFTDPEVLLGAMRSGTQETVKPRLDALVTVIVGYVDHVMDRIGEKLVPSYSMVTEAVRRRRVEASDADRFVEQMFGVTLTQDRYERGEAFINGVVERAGIEGLDRLWADEADLPTPAEVEAPGLWLARIDLPILDDAADLPDLGGLGEFTDLGDLGPRAASATLPTTPPDSGAARRGPARCRATAPTPWPTRFEPPRSTIPPCTSPSPPAPREDHLR